MSEKFEIACNLTFYLKKGDEDAFVYLINRFNTRLLDYTTSLTNNRNVAQDIVQDVFLDVWKDRKRLNDMDLPSLKHYIYKIAYHKFVNQYHKNKAITLLEHAYIEAVNQTFDDSNAELLERKIALVSEGINTLPKKCKEAFILSKKEGLTNTEIAQYMDISIKTVEGHLTKAYFLLKESIGDKIKHILFMLFGKVKKRLSF